MRIGNHKMMALTYVWVGENQLEGEWDNETYRLGHMKQCIEVCIPKEFETANNHSS